jgi:hypothetical protein
MPGLVGHVASSSATADVSRALQKLAHFARYTSTTFKHTPAMHVGHVLRPSRRAEPATAISPDARIAVHLVGHAVRLTQPRGDISAARFLDDYLQGTFDPDIADGGFVGCIVDLNQNCLQIFNDRLGTLPVVYAKNARGFAFAPEAKAVFATLGIQPKYAASGVVSLLTAGYCLGDETLFEEIRCLEPGSILRIDLATLELKSHRYWKLTYEENKDLRNRNDASAALYESIKTSHETVLDPESAFDVLLSGGLDSRCMFASAVRTGRIPKRAFGWGGQADIPYTDPYIAAKLAAHFGVRYDFFRYDTDAFLENAKPWSYTSELANDNIGWYAEGASVLANSYDSSMDYTMVGDENWGWGGDPKNFEEMLSEVLPATLHGRFAECAKPQVRESSAAMYRASIMRVLRDSENTRLVDQKDFLYLHGRVARFIFSLGYYKELAVEVRRPFMTRATLEVVRGLPPQFRFHKNLYCSMLNEYFPELRQFPRNLTSSLPDWRHDITRKPQLRDFFARLLSRKALEASAVSELLDPSAVENAWTEYAQQPVQPLDRSVRKSRLLKNWLIPDRALIWRAGRGAVGGTTRSDFDFFRALALLVLLEQQFKELAH